MDRFPDVIALSMTKTSRMNKKGATTNRIMVEPLFRKATLAAQQRACQTVMSEATLGSHVNAYLVCGTEGSKTA